MRVVGRDVRRRPDGGKALVLLFRSKLPGFAGTVALAAALAACGSTVGTGPGKIAGDPDTSLNAPVGKVTSSALPGVQAATGAIGSGPVKIALILPLTAANGQPSQVGQSLRNAADLAYADAAANDVTILVRDDHSTPEGARDAATQVLSEGAEIVIGPLFAPDVREVSKVVRAAGKPMIAFSTDTSAASHGSYLLSFLIESYVDRVVDFAASRGKKSAAAMIPDNDYGRVADAEFQAETARRGIRVLGIEHFSAATRDAAVAKIAALGDGIDMLFIPEQASGMPAMATALAAANIAPKRVQILGTGLWNDPTVLNLPALQGAWFAAPENGGFNAFAARYRAKYNIDPTRIATLSYDAVSLVAALAKSQGAQRFSDGVLLNRSGFSGADGVFRFRADGLNDRGLAVLQINNGKATPISPAPKTFPAGESASR